MNGNNNVSFKDIFLKGAVIFNPVLVQLVGLCPVVAAATNLQRAAVLSVIACIDLIAVCVIASAFLKKFSRWIRVVLYFVIGLILICPLLWYVETKTLINLSLGIKVFVPIVAINSVVAVHCEQFAVKNDVKLAFYDAAAVGIGASVVMIVVGAIREVLGYSTIGGIALNLPVAFKGMTLPFGCLILLGFMAAGLKSFVLKKYPEYAQAAFAVKKKESKKADNSKKAEKIHIPEIHEAPVAEEIPPQEEPLHTEAPVDYSFLDEITKGTESEQKKAESHEEIRIRTEDEIDEFFKSLGLFPDEKGDEQ